MKSFKMGFRILSLLILCLGLLPNASAQERPTYIMTAKEIAQLPDLDRSAYLGQIRMLLGSTSTSLLLSTSNDCGETQRQCEASLFGEHVCIPKHSSVSVSCAQKMDRNLDFSQAAWPAYYDRVQSFCTQKKNDLLCTRLKDTRISVFMGRRTH